MKKAILLLALVSLSLGATKRPLTDDEFAQRMAMEATLTPAEINARHAEIQAQLRAQQRQIAPTYVPTTSRMPAFKKSKSRQLFQDPARNHKYLS